MNDERPSASDLRTDNARQVIAKANKIQAAQWALQVGIRTTAPPKIEEIERLTKFFHEFLSGEKSKESE
jgi:hypothetical protein